MAVGLRVILFDFLKLEWVSEFPSIKKRAGLSIFFKFFETAFL